MEEFSSVEALVDHCVVDALRYTDRTLKKLAPAAVAASRDPRNDANTISLDMRRSLPEATRFLSLQIFRRLAGFAAEAEQAFEDDRKQLLPAPKNDVDYTVRVIWKGLDRQVLDMYAAKADWKPDTWNPYGDFGRAMAVLVAFIERKHFPGTETKRVHFAKAPGAKKKGKDKDERRGKSGARARRR